MADPAVDPQHRSPLLVFVHIPKTAGTTMLKVLRMNEPGPRTRHGGNVFKGGGGIKRGVKFEKLLRNTNGELDGAMVLTGHFPLGIRERLPNDRLARYFTLLREPADRMLSHYFQIREKRARADGPTKLGLAPLPAGATLGDALARGYLLDNVQTRMLSGLPEPFGEVDDEMLEQAKRNLREGLACFGLTERFDESLVLAKQRLGLRAILYGSTRRVNTSRPRGDEVPEELRRAAERCNRYDIELYRYAEQLFYAAPEREDPDFEVELAALRAANSVGEIELHASPPTGFGGDHQTWRMLLHARAQLVRLEAELAGSQVKAATARSRTRGLKRRMEDLEAPPARMQELEREVERLESAAARVVELEQEVQRLETAARTRPKRDSRRDTPKPARARPKRNVKHAGSKPAEASRGKPRRREGGKRPRAGDGG